MPWISAEPATAFSHRARRHAAELQRAQDVRRQGLGPGVSGVHPVDARSQGVEPLGGARDVHAPARHLERHLVRAGHHRAGTRPDASLRKVGPEVQAEDSRDAVLLEDARLADASRAARRLLGGLEDEENVPRQLLARPDHAGRLLGKTEFDGRVAVVPAGVHAPRPLGGEEKPRALGHGQRIHVGAQGDRLLCARVEVRAHAALDGREDLGAERLEHLPHVGRRIGQLVVELGHSVQDPAVVDGIEAHGRVLRKCRHKDGKAARRLSPPKSALDKKSCIYIMWRSFGRVETAHLGNRS